MSKGDEMKTGKWFVVPVILLAMVLLTSCSQMRQLEAENGELRNGKVQCEEALNKCTEENVELNEKVGLMERQLAGCDEELSNLRVQNYQYLMEQQMMWEGLKDYLANTTVVLYANDDSVDTVALDSLAQAFNQMGVITYVGELDWQPVVHDGCAQFFVGPNSRYDTESELYIVWFVLRWMLGQQVPLWFGDDEVLMTENWEQFDNLILREEIAKYQAGRHDPEAEEDFILVALDKVPVPGGRKVWPMEARNW